MQRGGDCPTAKRRAVLRRSDRTWDVSTAVVLDSTTWTIEEGAVASSSHERTCAEELERDRACVRPAGGAMLPAIMKMVGWAFVPMFALAACHAQPPPNWAQGGTPLDIPRARWTRGDKLIDIMPDGKVLGDGEHLFTLDRAGRVYQPDNEPVAVLQADGRLVGKDDAVLGKIGVRNSSPPGKDIAWLSISERGEVVR